MRKIYLPIFVCLLAFLPLGFLVPLARAETKEAPGRVIPKLTPTPNDPELVDGHVYPEWGPVCQRYTYSVVYKDKEGRPPEYVQIYFNGQMIDMTKADPADSNYRQGVRYEYKNVPHKLGSNFYYFEASNGLGKTRDSIIDSPDNGPVLFASALDKNEVVLIDPQTGQAVWRFPTGKEWVGGVALSDDGQYLAVLTSHHVYLFATTTNQPLWEYTFNQSSPIGGGPRGNGIAISGDGSQIVVATGMEVSFFGKEKNQPLWKHPSPALAVTISKDGRYAAASAVKQGSGESGNVILFWQTEASQPFWEFVRDSNFHDVSLSADGQYLAASTGCPDRKAYIFSKESHQPLVQSERLTYDSPVSKSKISADGSLAAFATEGGPGSSVVALFSKDSPQPLWQFDNQKRNSSRALAFTPNGQFIAAATMSGDVYLLGQESSEPLASWQVNTSVGALDLANDGSFIALGGTDNRVQILTKEGERRQVDLNEFAQAIDISGNGQYVAAGTGGSVYFFEDYLTPDRNKVFDCQKIIEPPPREMAMIGDGQSPGLPRPFSTASPPQQKAPLGLVVGGGALLVYGLLFFKLSARRGLLQSSPPRFNLFNHPAIITISLPLAVVLAGINGYQLNFRVITDFCAAAFGFWSVLLLLSLATKIPAWLYLIGAIFFSCLGALTLVTYRPFFSWPTGVHLTEAVLGFGYLASFFKRRTGVIFLAGVAVFLAAGFLFHRNPNQNELLLAPNDRPNPGQAQGEAVCGNNLCEPNLGETKESCPQDCSAGD